MNYKIVTKFIKDISFEIPDAETFLLIEKNLSKYNLKVDINSKHLKNKLVQVDTTLKIEGGAEIIKKSQIEITLAAVVNIEDEIKKKEDLRKILLINVPTEIYPMLFGILKLLIEKSGLPAIRIEKEIDFEKLYLEKNI